jgi:hypothetical protein
MSNSLFIKSFSFVFILVLVGLYGFSNYSQYQRHLGLYFVGLGFFSILTFLVYFLAGYYSKLSDDQKYIKLVFLNVGIKFLATILIPVVYFFMFKKPDGLFIVPFLFVYLLFTIYETWMLNKMALMRK